MQKDYGTIFARTVGSNITSSHWTSSRTKPSFEVDLCGRLDCDGVAGKNVWLCPLPALANPYRDPSAASPCLDEHLRHYFFALHDLFGDERQY